MDIKRFGLACLAVLALAAAIRLPGLTRESFWLDEAYSALFPPNHCPSSGATRPPMKPIHLSSIRY
ncbi:hypothetical protein [Rhizobium sp. G21]|uniref:hypothetical protein n=1 Tax=Rhizobium sp. G21 TaxID=2758439 RepID=UPI001600D24C|nr:hypothetical protein [Rhizobium sp. G21]MBB1248140.1 hypothetical protein [Rhizobium sp. G21]